ncbi:MAG: hypothetical protein COT17_00245 [Elusimicrobia bacterium CG08_land_8_20_14_0_20_51_18]|nr:MAG: hypothetical protein COT17_00245 [Elusimicrobia bacterium CG08_land_8_20_14_0_20_51_18]
MKILILGGTSFFGKETARLAFSNGNEVSVFSRKAPVEGLPLDIKQIRGDRTVEADLTRLSLQKWDIIFDNICYSGEDALKAVKVFNGRVGRYIVTSSEAVYYIIKDLASPFRENHTEIMKDRVERKKAGEAGHDGNRQKKKGGVYDYARGKLEAENVFLKAWNESRFPVTIVRPPIVIGPEDNTLRAQSYWMRIADGYPFFAPGYGQSKRFAYSRDMARWLYDIMRKDSDLSGEIFNLGDEKEISLGDFLKISAEIMNKPLLSLPADFDWLKANGFDSSCSPYSSKRDYIMDITKAREKLGLVSTPIREWLDESLNWFFFKFTGTPPANYAGRKQEIELAQKWISEKKETGV